MSSDALVKRVAWPHWTKALNDGASVPDVLASFAELPENFARTKASIEAGFLIDPSYFRGGAKLRSRGRQSRHRRPVH